MTGAHMAGARTTDQFWARMAGAHVSIRPFISLNSEHFADLLKSTDQTNYQILLMEM